MKHAILLLFSTPALLLAVSFELIHSQITTKGLTRIEDVLESLPHPFLSQFILVYRSRSLQAASGLNPRVIFYEPDGSFFMSINGDPSQKGYSHMEIFEQTARAPRGHFYTIDFSTHKPTITKDPTSCFTCHTKLGRTIWDPYDLWPGVMGSNSEAHQPLVDPKERSHLKQFSLLASAHPRYRYLNFTDDALELPVLFARNRLFTTMVLHTQAKRLALLVKQPSAFLQFKPAWESPHPGKAFIQQLPKHRQARALRKYAEMESYLCNRILLATVRRLLRQTDSLTRRYGLLQYTFDDLQPLEAIARALTIADAADLNETFELLSSVTLDRESYVSNDGSDGFWRYFYSELTGQPAQESLFAGQSATFTQQAGTYSLTEPHPRCGSYSWP